MTAFRTPLLIGSFLLFGLEVSATTAVALGWPDDPKTFSQGVAEHVEQRKISLSEAEQQLLQHAQTAPNEEQGEIFSALSKLFQSNLPESAAKLYEYCQKALTFPLPRPDQVHVWIRLAGLAQRESGHLSELSDPARKEAALCWLHALKPIEDVGRVGSTKSPSVNRYHFEGPPDSPRLKELQQQHQEEIVGRKKADEESALEIDRWIVTQSLAALYSARSADLSELQLLAQQCSLSPLVIAELLRTTRAVARLGHALPAHEVDALLQRFGN